jgi:hypothetical protein
MSEKRNTRILLILAVLALAAGTVFLSLTWLYNRVMQNYESPPEITIINTSDTDLHDVVVRGSGFRETIGMLPAGAELSFEVKPAGESGLAIEFTANDRQYADDDLAYIESKGGYWAEIIITDNFAVEVDSGFKLLR